MVRASCVPAALTFARAFSSRIFADVDDIVLRGMAKWPNVPAVYGWLALDRRGKWSIKGEPITNPAIADFIGRNYERDSAGRWFFQNGPQRVFVTLEYTPFVYRASSPVGAPLALAAHTGARAQELRGAWLDEHGSVVLETELGPGVLDDRDLDVLAALFADSAGDAPDDDTLDAAIERAQRGGDPALWIRHPGGPVKLGVLSSTGVPQRFDYQPRPAAPAGHPECA